MERGGALRDLAKLLRLHKAAFHELAEGAAKDSQGLSPIGAYLNHRVTSGFPKWAAARVVVVFRGKCRTKVC
jgi:hypothetical protein